MRLSKKRAAQYLALVNLLCLFCITGGCESLRAIIITGAIFLSGSIFWAIKGGLFE